MSDVAVTLAPVTSTPVVTLYNQAGNTLNPATQSIQLALQAFMKGDKGKIGRAHV